MTGHPSTLPDLSPTQGALKVPSIKNVVWIVGLAAATFVGLQHYQARKA